MHRASVTVTSPYNWMSRQTSPKCHIYWLTCGMSGRKRLGRTFCLAKSLGRLQRQRTFMIQWMIAWRITELTAQTTSEYVHMAPRWWLADTRESCKESKMSPPVPVQHTVLFCRETRLLQWTLNQGFMRLWTLPWPLWTLLKQEPLCEDVGSDHHSLFTHTEVRWLSRGLMHPRLFSPREELCMFLSDKRPDLAEYLSDEKWLVHIGYLADIFRNKQAQ